MKERQVSIGQVKRDISDLVNRVAYGGERIILTSRSKPKAALIGLADYERIVQEDREDATGRLQAWLQRSDQLADRIDSRRQGVPIDVDAALERGKSDLEERHDFLRGG